jgi:hypothetical protein
VLARQDVARVDGDEKEIRLSGAAVEEDGGGGYCEALDPTPSAALQNTTMTLLVDP